MKPWSKLSPEEKASFVEAYGCEAAACAMEHRPLEPQEHQTAEDGWTTLYASGLPLVRPSLEEHAGA